MQNVTKLADAAAVADPSPELVLIAALIVNLTKGNPKKVQRLCEDLRSFVDTHREMAGVIRLRGAEYDADVLRAMAQASAWLNKMEPFLLMMARR